MYPHSRIHFSVVSPPTCQIIITIYLVSAHMQLTLFVDSHDQFTFGSKIGRIITTIHPIKFFYHSDSTGNTLSISQYYDCLSARKEFHILDIIANLSVNNYSKSAMNILHLAHSHQRHHLRLPLPATGKGHPEILAVLQVHRPLGKLHRRSSRRKQGGHHQEKLNGTYFKYIPMHILRF